ncbi:MAG: ThiF family adenylyltransferase [Candidatus Korarchaeota archaeon]
MTRAQRYSRIDAIKDFGYDIDWSILATKTVLIAGVGGLGSIVGEIMARFGVAKIILVDFDVVKEVNLNRLFYRPSDINKPKAEAAKRAILEINPEVEVTSLVGDIMRLEETEPNFRRPFEYWVKYSDIVANCLDNHPARMYLNEVCVKNKRVYANAGVARDGLSGSLHLVIPYKTACAQCIGSIEIRSKASSQECDASLPTTMGIIATLQAHMIIKHLVGFGRIPSYITYNALTDELKEFEVVRDPHCPVCGETRKLSPEESEKLIDEYIKRLQHNHNIH